MQSREGLILPALWCPQLFLKVAVLDTLEIIPFGVVLSCEGHITLTTSETRTQEHVMVQQEQRIEVSGFLPGNPT